MAGIGRDGQGGTDGIGDVAAFGGGMQHGPAARTGSLAILKPGILRLQPQPQAGSKLAQGADRRAGAWKSAMKRWPWACSSAMKSLSRVPVRTPCSNTASTASMLAGQGWAALPQSSQPSAASAGA